MPDLWKWKYGDQIVEVIKRTPNMVHFFLLNYECKHEYDSEYRALRKDAFEDQYTELSPLEKLL